MKSLPALILTLAVLVGVSLAFVLPSCDQSGSLASEKVPKEVPKPRIEKQQQATAPSASQPQAAVAVSQEAAPLPEPAPNPAPIGAWEERPFTMEEARQIVAAAGRKAIDPKREVAERARYLGVLSRQMASSDDAEIQAALETVLGHRNIWPAELQQTDHLLQTSFFIRWGFIVGTGKSQQTKEFVQFVDLVVSHEQKFPDLVAQAFFILTDGASRYDHATHGLENLVSPGLRLNQPGMTVKEFWEKTPLYSWR